MKTDCHLCQRRHFIRTSLLGAATFFTSPGSFAERLALTPKSTEGPFYPDKLPLDTDNDLIIINDKITPAVGTITHLSGIVLDQNAQPIRNALVEIWEADNNGIYLHSKGGDRKKLDSNFQGYGRFLTDQKGRYYFRTIKPTPYVGRTPHIHVIVSKKGKHLLTTQCYIEGEKLNEKDSLYNRLPQEKRKLLTSSFKPLKGSKTGELTAEFNIVIGHTPEDQ